MEAVTAQATTVHLADSEEARVPHTLAVPDLLCDQFSNMRRGGQRIA